jgi:hypothetical protein
MCPTLAAAATRTHDTDHPRKLVAPTTTKSFGSMIHPSIELRGRPDAAGLMEINVALRAVVDLE